MTLDNSLSLTKTQASSGIRLPSRPINIGPILFALLVLALGAAFIGNAVNARQAALYLLGAALGIVLYHAAFGFTSAWRVFIADRRGAGLRAQMAMLAVATFLFFPALASGSLLGQPVTGALAPLGTSVVVGAFLFGLGMQLGGGCASGTLYTVGGGSTRMVITLIGFIAGSTIGAAHLHWWTALPSLPPVSAVASLGPWRAFAVHVVVFALIASFTVVLERQRHGRLVLEFAAPGPGLSRILRGPWPLLAGAVGLALLNFATLAFSGHPWSITSAFALWGSKIAGGVGFDPASWPYWSTPGRAGQLAGNIFADITSVMDIGIVAGALLAAGLAGRFAPLWRVPPGAVIAAIVGGLLLGYGARLAYGCNIGAYFSGIASGSLHGWLWLAAAFAGGVVGTHLRPLFGLAVERTKPTSG
jgi:uncharacterized membrane protein YedE/YeeE